MSNFDQLPLRKCRYGWMLHDNSDYIGKCFDLYGEYSESEVAAMRNFVRSGDVVLDIGANIGDLTLPLAQMVGPTGKVYAFESHPDVFNILCANLALNKISHVQPINAFVKKSDDALMQDQFIRKGMETKSIRIDDLGLERCRLIKVDVDGNELDVLQSGQATIDKFRPILYLENDIRDKSKSLLEYLMMLNYDVYWHIAPIFSENNFLNNPVNHWAPNGIVSLMVLAIPKEQGFNIAGLAKIKSPDEWVM